MKITNFQILTHSCKFLKKLIVYTKQITYLDSIFFYKFMLFEIHKKEVKWRKWKCIEVSEFDGRYGKLTIVEKGKSLTDFDHRIVPDFLILNFIVS